jgi:vacuolar-type H+-ATPase subunit H
MSSADKNQSHSKNTVERLAAIVDAAEQAALQVIDDAEKEARRYLDEARERADRMVAETLREKADELDSDSGKVTKLRPAEPEPETEAGAPPAGNTLNGSAAARLLATQMAVSGSTRKEIEARLRNAFEIEDTDEILDAILGPED